VACLRYGAELLDQAYAYHLYRRDHRHNFSPFFYHVYLGMEGAAGRTEALALFLPQVPHPPAVDGQRTGCCSQVVLLVVLAFAYRRELPFCVLLQTMVFVAFNKVITAQVTERAGASSTR
jgi:phosphatidylinositol glycan class M